mgnify:CR=1 FL=1
MTENYLINQSHNSAEILLYGFIGSWKDTDSKRFISDFKKLESAHNKINVRIKDGFQQGWYHQKPGNLMLAQKPQKDQKIDDIARDVARLVDPGGDGFKDRP